MVEVEAPEVPWPAAGTWSTARPLCPMQVVGRSLEHQLFFFINSLFSFVCL